ncbi:MAG: hypothetical protein ACOY35_01265 [Bacillota bacterium]
MNYFIKAILKLALFTLSIIIIGTLLLLQLIDTELQSHELNKFKKATINKYDFIKDIDIYGIAPHLRISFSLNREVNFTEIERVFEETKDFILSEDVFADLQKLHSEKHGDTFITITIDFNYSQKDEIIDYYRFDSHDNFKIWRIEHNGTQINSINGTGDG